MLRRYDRYQDLLRDFPIYRQYVQMDAYEGDTPKGLMLWSDSPKLLETVVSFGKPVKTVKRLCRVHYQAGHKKTTGNRQAVKESEAYTEKFGESIVPLLELFTC